MDLGSGGGRADTLARAMTDARLPERLALPHMRSPAAWSLRRVSVSKIRRSPMRSSGRASMFISRSSRSILGDCSPKPMTCGRRRRTGTDAGSSRSARIGPVWKSGVGQGINGFRQSVEARKACCDIVRWSPSGGHWQEPQAGSRACVPSNRLFARPSPRDSGRRLWPDQDQSPGGLEPPGPRPVRGRQCHSL